MSHKRVLKPEEKIIILRSLIKYYYKGYWDFFFHHTSLSDRSLEETLLVSGFSITKIAPQFLPFSTTTPFNSLFF
jgi:hypothetical protein